MTELIGLPEPPELGAPALPDGTFDGVCVFITGAGTGLGKAIAAAFDAAVETFGLPSVLVNNAAANFPATAEDLSPNAWRTVVDITLNGTYFCSREFGRRHLAESTPGSIINVGASYAWTGGPGFAHSAAAKAGVKNMA